MKGCFGLICILALASIQMPNANAQIAEVNLLPFGNVSDGESVVIQTDTPLVKLELLFKLGYTSEGSPAMSASLAWFAEDDLSKSGNTPNHEPHPPGDNPLVNVDPRLPVRPKKDSPTLGIFEPAVDPKIEIPLTSNPPKTPNGKLTGPGIDVQTEVLEDFDDKHPTPTQEEKDLRNKIRIACEHTEGHAAGILHEHPEIPGGVLTINNPPCSNCQGGIPHILNPGQILVVVYPERPFGDPKTPKKTGYWVGGDPDFHVGEPPKPPVPPSTPKP